MSRIRMSFMLAVALLFSLLFAASPVVSRANSEMTESETVAELTNCLALPDEGLRTGYGYEEYDDIVYLTLKYEGEGAVLSRLLGLLRSLEPCGWCFGEDDAFRYSRGLAISWRQEEGTAGTMLSLRYKVLRDHLPEWPEGVPPCLANEIPAYPYGTCPNVATGREPLRDMEAVCMKYEDTGLGELREYETMLANHGFVLEQDSDSNLFTRRDIFVVSHWEEDPGIVMLCLGWLPSPDPQLPPWPEALPEWLREILPPVSAILHVTLGIGEYKVDAKNMSLRDLYKFYQEAHERYGWTEVEGTGIHHLDTDVWMKSYTYDPESWAWTAYIIGVQPHETEVPPTPTPSPSPSPEPPRTRQPYVSPTPASGRRAREGSYLWYGETSTGEPYEIALTDGSCDENEVTATVQEEFADSAMVADWLELKRLYGDMLPYALNRIGLGNEQCAWLSVGGSLTWSQNPQRHYFIQRFDNGAPNSFLAHDSVGSLYLGSWYDIPARVLVCR